MIDPVLYRYCRAELRAVALIAGALLTLAAWALPDLIAWATGTPIITGACK